jgi:hypothetical protein
MFMTRWEELMRDFKELQFWTDISLQWAKKYYIRMDDTDTYVITMCQSLTDICCSIALTSDLITVLNPAQRFSWIEGQWERGYIEDVKNTILKLIRPHTISDHFFLMTCRCTSTVTGNHQRPKSQQLTPLPNLPQSLSSNRFQHSLWLKIPYTTKENLHITSPP